MDVSANFGQLKDHHGVWDALTLEVEGARHMCTTPLAHTSSLHGVNNSTKPHSFHWPYRTHKCSPHLLWGWSNIASILTSQTHSRAPHISVFPLAPQSAQSYRFVALQKASAATVDC